MKLGVVSIVALSVAAAAGAGCSSKRESVVSQLAGSEPQRISFGDPQSVHRSFSEKVHACWFNGHNPALAGYTLDARPMLASDGDAAPAIRILPAAPVGGPAQGFEVQFHTYNGNTLISTRNHTLPSELAARLRQDIDTWIFGRAGCGDASPSAAPPPFAPAPRLAPQNA
ncbi:MAG: hypothetical protein NW215_04520 [Hyphomicrobiales bacterium]|nr:hypothetical protein [Hyphomicrobiales bacterium]